jgi:hypothetical protein
MMQKWPELNGKYISYPSFKKQWWAYRGNYLEMAGDSMVAKSLKEKCINVEVKLVFENIVDLQEICSTLDICYEHLKNIAWVLQHHCELQYV